jgi:hypothetical protein
MSDIDFTIRIEINEKDGFAFLGPWVEIEYTKHDGTKVRVSQRASVAVHDVLNPPLDENGDPLYRSGKINWFGVYDEWGMSP